MDYVKKFSPKVDEQFSLESKTSLLTNKDYDWTGANTVAVYTVTTADMNDYDRQGVNSASGYISRYGPIQGLDATTQEYTLTKDRSFSFAIDKLDRDETAQVLSAGSALARQQREVVIPEIDTYVLNKMVTGAGTKEAAKALTSENIYDEILEANSVLDDYEVLEANRVLVVTPTTYQLLKRSKDFLMATDPAQEMLIRGIVAMIDGLAVMKVPASRLPAGFGFMVAHPVATVAPVKLSEFKTHEDPPFISGSLVEGRINYDAFVLANKKNAIYYQPIEVSP
ncbi:MAG: hypothetical protein GX328_05570 [Clostridiaceae bacterium]|nr:hypothetical protein [Clostridiaceae bacterium]